MADLLKAVLVQPGEDARAVEVPGGLDAMQGLVGGSVSALTIAGRLGARRLTAWTNDESLLLCLPWNRQAGEGVYLAGPILILADDPAGATVSLTAEEQARVVALVNGYWPKLSPSPDDLRRSSVEEAEELLGGPAIVLL